MVSISKLALVILFFAAFSSVQSQSKTDVGTRVQDCGFKKDVLDPLIDEAERGQFIVRRVEFSGTTSARDRELRKKLEPGMNEGHRFIRAALERSVSNLGKMKQLYPLTIEDVEIRLDKTSGDIDLVICVIQKPRLR